MLLKVSALWYCITNFIHYGLASLPANSLGTQAMDLGSPFLECQNTILCCC